MRRESRREATNLHRYGRFWVVGKRCGNAINLEIEAVVATLVFFLREAETKVARAVFLFGERRCHVFVGIRPEVHFEFGECRAAIIFVG